jgi:hypothetical protein
MTQPEIKAAPEEAAAKPKKPRRTYKRRAKILRQYEVKIGARTFSCDLAQVDGAILCTVVDGEATYQPITKKVVIRQIQLAPAATPLWRSNPSMPPLNAIPSVFGRNLPETDIPDDSDIDRRLEEARQRSNDEFRVSRISELEGLSSMPGMPPPELPIR